MALIGEEIVEEWVRLQGYFTIRGLKLGVHEIDILAIKPLPNGIIDCRHIECQISFNPISFICPWTKDLQKSLGVAKNAAKLRDGEQMQQCVESWIQKKFLHPRKVMLRNNLCANDWKCELVIGNAKYKEEVECIKSNNINVMCFSDILHELQNMVNSKFDGASSKNIYELMKWSSLVPKGV